jgi:hypothetical protein
MHAVPRLLVIGGAVLLFLGAAIHVFAAYPHVAAALSSSNLSSQLKPALQSVFLLAGWDWLALGVLALIALRATAGRKLLLVFCGVTVLVETAITLAFIGPFLGNEMIGTAAILILAGAGLLKPV